MVLINARKELIAFIQTQEQLFFKKCIELRNLNGNVKWITLSIRFLFAVLFLPVKYNRVISNTAVENSLSIDL